VSVVHPRIRPAAFRDHRADLRVGPAHSPTARAWFDRGKRDQYSRPSGVNPPRPLRRFARAGTAQGIVATSADRVVEVRESSVPPGACRSTCSARVSAPSVRITRATVCNKTRSPPIIVRCVAEKSAGFIHAVRLRAARNQAQDAFLQDLTIPGKIFIEDNQIDW